MSPLFRSLLALAALLAAANAQSICAYKAIGMEVGTMIEYPPQQVPAPYKKLEIPIDNCPPGTVVVGETIEVCNNVAWNSAPTLEGPPLDKYSPVIVTCVDCPDGSTARITQWCGSLPAFRKNLWSS